MTLLFADIAGFTKYSSSVEPGEVVKMLRYLFTEFDKMCIKHQVYKVYTIGGNILKIIRNFFFIIFLQFFYYSFCCNSFLFFIF